MALTIERRTILVDNYVVRVAQVAYLVPSDISIGRRSHFAHITGNAIFGLQQTTNLLFEGSAEPTRIRAARSYFVRDLRGLRAYLRLAKENQQFREAELSTSNGCIAEVLPRNERLGSCGLYAKTARERLEQERS